MLLSESNLKKEGRGASSCARISAGTALAFNSHGQSHSRAARPKTTNIARQPNWTISNPPSSVPTAGPNDTPATTNPLAYTSDAGGTCRASKFEMKGNAGH